jgi:hypothetical protein
MKSNSPKSSRWRAICCAALLLASCDNRKADDTFARSFLTRLYAGDPRIEDDLDPHSTIARHSSQSLSREAVAHLPSTKIDSIRLAEWYTVKDARGRARQLRYHVFAGDSLSAVEVWLTRDGDKHFQVNTLHFSDPQLRTRE